ncbi:3'(2'),5'-bisphosphate nucleotidase CysQ [Rhizobiaceae bacterium n13]|uniref:3'(2'),5'-bisphosphate nucleotidase CysQ n=1 Tax=Ferirhizobium litorale TaxID=2927786 RepID=A0AAE3TZA9_9HYPH|nr:3'(2'),5'-bisphosphate nucleotidase CysQ [Fererhizobium litorale]MDI7860651.1 3'(2'),5'-bisphosphate nucleotidase CysQ [Fererhizobium litorale]MDI7920799.1 3'(2'),5'-bisphosphate nucleotidase CysQ [Fererhizobium litorale]
MQNMLKVLEQAALAAGQAILDVYSAGPSVTLKDDASPVTEADERAEAIILARLAEAFPDIPVIAEESVAAGRIPDTDGKPFFLVDPLDGTKEFINRRDDFTVNIALIRDGVPVAGVVYAPAQGVAYSADNGRAEKLVVDSNFEIAERHEIHCRAGREALTAVASRSHITPETEEFLVENDIDDCKTVGSSLKFCLVAEGLADVYPRFGRTMEWDTAAGDAVLRAAGGRVEMTDGQPFTYGKKNQFDDCDFANPGFIAWGRCASKSKPAG